MLRFVTVLALFLLASTAQAAPQTLQVTGKLKTVLLATFTSQAADADPNTDVLTPSAAGATLATSRILVLGSGQQYPRGLGWFFTGGASEVCAITPWQYDQTAAVWVSAAGRTGATPKQLDVMSDLNPGYIFLQVVCSGSFVSPTKLYAGIIEGVSMKGAQ